MCVCGFLTSRSFSFALESSLKHFLNTSPSAGNPKIVPRLFTDALAWNSNFIKRDEIQKKPPVERILLMVVQGLVETAATRAVQKIDRNAQKVKAETIQLRGRDRQAIEAASKEKGCTPRTPNPRGIYQRLRLDYRSRTWCWSWVMSRFLG